MRHILYIGTILVLFTACTPTRKKENISHTPMKVITLGVMPSVDYLPFIVAQKAGIYDTLGLTVNLIKYYSSTDRDHAFQSAQIDGTITDFLSAFQLKSSGIPLKIIMRNESYLCMIVRNGSNITSIKELKNKNIAVSRNTVVDYTTDFIIKTAGILPQQVNRPEIDNIPLRLLMLENGQIDASLFPDPYATIAMSNGHKSLTSTSELNISVTGTVFSARALKEKKKEIELLIKGYNLGVDYIQNHPTDSLKQILIEEIGIPEALAGIIALPQYTHASLPSMDDLEKCASWLIEKNIIHKSFQYANVIDSSYIQYEQVNIEK